jgi:hypothetical protein
MGKGGKGNSMKVTSQQFQARSSMLLALFVALLSVSSVQAERRTRQDLGEVLTPSICQLYPRDDDQLCTTEVQPLAIRAVVISTKRSLRRDKNRSKSPRRIRVRGWIYSDKDGHLTNRRRKLPRGTYSLRLRAVAVKDKSFAVDDLRILPGLLKVHKGEPQFLTVAHESWDNNPILVAY